MKLFCPECQSTFEGNEFEMCPEDGARLYSLEVQTDPLVGATIDERFRVGSMLGQGGMGAVYKGVQLSVNRDVAIKVLRPELLQRELALERFYRESKIISELSHPNIVRLIDFGQDRERDLLYLVMELVNGVDLGGLLEKGRMRAAFALEIIYQVCGALTEPHARGVIHRDLKPDNLLLVPVSDGTIQAKVLDFGIARALETNTQLTADGMVCGTPQYMAPEQAQNMEIGPPTDLYALGTLLYEMLCGVPPFYGNNSLQVMLQHIQTSPERLSKMLPKGAMPIEIESLVNDMLAKDPAARPQHARDVRDRIDKIRRKYDMELVRIDPNMDRDEMFSSYILPKLPGTHREGPMSYTEMLQRETGLDDIASFTSANTADAQVVDDMTTPLSEVKRNEIFSDGPPQHQGRADDSARFARDPSTGNIISERDLDMKLTVPKTPAARPGIDVQSPSPAHAPYATAPTPYSKPAAKRGGLYALLGLVVLFVLAAVGVIGVLMLKEDTSKPEQPIAVVDPVVLPTAEVPDPTTKPPSEPEVVPKDPLELTAKTEPKISAPVKVKPVVVKKTNPKTSPKKKPVVAQPKPEPKLVVKKTPEVTPAVKNTPEPKVTPEVKPEVKPKSSLFGQNPKKPKKVQNAKTFFEN